MNAFDHLSGELLTRLAWTSLQAALLVVLIALLLRLRPNLPAAMRCALWWLVALQAVVGLAAPAPLELPWMAAPSQVSGTSINVSNPTAALQAAPVPQFQEQQASAAAAAAAAWVPDWPRVLLSLWLAGVLVQIPLLLSDARRVRRLRGQASTSSEALRRQCRDLSQTMLLARAPGIEMIPGVRSPQIVGLRHPTILWPGDTAFSDEETAMAMAHELAHLKRGDLWLGWLPAIARRLFFFHPLIAIAVREYALQREAACDAQVLQQKNVDPRAYGQLLLRLGVDRALPAGLAGASPTFANLKRRLTMLQQSKPIPRLHTWLLIAAIAAIGVVPYRVTAAAKDVTAVSQNTTSTSTPPAPPAPPAPPPAPGIPPPPPPPAPPELPAGLATLHHVNIDTDNHADSGFALVDGESATIRGSSEDTAAVARLHKHSDSLLWVRNGEQGYVIRDPSILAKAREIQAPLTKLVREQGKLSGRQGEIAGHESGIAAHEAGFGAERAALGERRAELASRLAEGGRPQALAEYAREDQALDAEQNRIDARYQAMERDLALQRQDLAKQRGDIAGQMSALNERSKRMTASNREAMDRLVAEAINQGKAKKISLP